MPQSVSVSLALLADALACQPDAEFLIGQSFGMGKWQIEKMPDDRWFSPVEAARDRLVGHIACKGIGRKCLRRAAEHISRKLIEQQNQRECAVSGVAPGFRRPASRFAPALREPVLQQRVEYRIAVKPPLSRRFFEPEVQKFARFDQILQPG